MKKLTGTQLRSSAMNRNNQKTKRTNAKPRAPLYASPWVALYTVLRQELMQTRPDNG